MVEQVLERLLTGNVYAFMLVFARIGAAFTLLPGFADAYVPVRARLLLALAISVVVVPVVAGELPPMPASALALGLLVIGESVTGFFLGSISRVLLGALDVAGMIVSMQTGLAAAMIFNPALATQGTLVGVLLTNLGIVLMFVTDLHHLLILAVVGSYEIFVPGTGLPLADFGQTVVGLVARSFAVGAQMAAPFLIVGIMFNVGLGVLQKLMPQIQIFFVAMSTQIALGLLMLMITLSAAMMFWLGHLEAVLIGLAGRG
ncbi:MAG TPA: flagellar biosynthetic protein FliR [Arenibaculum sp.]|nr:flagellar biosynthetic protein FliR [Arenibaculum sp.]